MLASFRGLGLIGFIGFIGLIGFRAWDMCKFLHQNVLKSLGGVYGQLSVLLMLPALKYYSKNPTAIPKKKTRTSATHD